MKFKLGDQVCYYSGGSVIGRGTIVTVGEYSPQYQVKWDNDTREPKWYLEINLRLIGDHE